MRLITGPLYVSYLCASVPVLWNDLLSELEGRSTLWFRNAANISDLILWRVRCKTLTWPIIKEFRKFFMLFVVGGCPGSVHGSHRNVDMTWVVLKAPLNPNQPSSQRGSCVYCWHFDSEYGGESDVAVETAVLQGFAFRFHWHWRHWRRAPVCAEGMVRSLDLLLLSSSNGPSINSPVDKILMYAMITVHIRGMSSK